MSRKIINIIIFVIAGIACLLTLWFAIGFDDNKEDLYYEAGIINENNPQLLADFKNVTLATLPAFVDQNLAQANEFNDIMKEEQLQKDILYTYIVQLQELTSETFPEYKTNFQSNSRVLFAKSDRSSDYISGFNNVTDFNSLPAYINNLESEYRTVKQNYLERKDYSRALNVFMKRASDINGVVSESKKIADLENLQNDVSQATSEAKTLNAAVIFTYIIFLLAIGLTLFFAIIQIAKNIKTSYKAILAILAIALVLVIGYFISSPDLSRSAIAENLTPNNVKWIGAGMITCYVVFIGAVASIIISSLMSKFKKV